MERKEKMTWTKEMGGANMVNDIKLTDIFDIELLQELQDNYFATTGISCGISDPNGVAITEHRSCNRLCKDFIKKSPVGLARCQECDKRGTEMVKDKGETIIYTCHAGLLDFTAPIVVEGQLIGCFLGGQVLKEKMDEEQARKTALEIGVDPEKFIEYAKELPIYTVEQLRTSANFLYSIGNMLSHMAYKKYHIQLANTQIEREANMKSDFLANMSHEIRTPMNAVIGMAEMALREDLPPTAREYINQILTAGNSLLTIINDILDFSKISAGKMDINMVEYEPVSSINDISNIIMTRIGKKNLELIVDYDPNIPNQLMGDNIRIKQVVMNLANNAVKFTREGRVCVKVSYTKKSDREVVLHFSINDTGIGIKEEDLEKLFQSFQQVDSKRNRNIEGTGLGLAISKQLVTLMNGKIWVESEYGKGSTFSFEIPQFVLRESPSIEIDDVSQYVAVLCENQYINESLQREFDRFGIRHINVDSSNYPDILHEEEPDLCFIDYPLYSDEVRESVKNNEAITFVLMVGFDTAIDEKLPNLIVATKPIYSLNIASILNERNTYVGDDPTKGHEFTFIAPEADILIVDDNEVNLTVAAGLMKPLQMNIDTALSGREAIEMIKAKHYDLIFMDHMMPDMDGIETTHVIREKYEEYNNVPIIALTANAVEEMRSMFLCEGMNDFIAKPIELPFLLSKLRHWLPEEKIKMISPEAVTTDSLDDSDADESIPENVEGIDVELALHYLGSRKLFRETLGNFYKAIERKASALEAYYQSEDWEHFTIDVHALKSSSKQIGAAALSEMAEKLEKAGQESDIEFIKKNTDSLLRDYRRYQEILQPYFEEKTEEIAKPDSSAEILYPLFSSAREALDNLDMDEMEEVLAKLMEYRYPSQQQALCTQLQDAVDNLDSDACEEIILEWEKLLK